MPSTGFPGGHEGLKERKLHGVQKRVDIPCSRISHVIEKGTDISAAGQHKAVKIRRIRKPPVCQQQGQLPAGSA